MVARDFLMPTSNRGHGTQCNADIDSYRGIAHGAGSSFSIVARVGGRRSLLALHCH